MCWSYTRDFLASLWARAACGIPIDSNIMLDRAHRNQEVYSIASNSKSVPRDQDTKMAMGMVEDVIAKTDHHASSIINTVGV